jgi:uncharacterized membrane protein
MTKVSRYPAVFAYLIPVIGWLYVFFFQRKNDLAIFHLRQAIGLFLFLIGAMIAWIVVATIIAFIPYMAALGMALFTLVIAAYMYGFVAWIMGMTNAFNSRLALLPLFGRWANRLPIR